MGIQNAVKLMDIFSGIFVRLLHTIKHISNISGNIFSIYTQNISLLIIYQCFEFINYDTYLLNCHNKPPRWSSGKYV